MTVTCIEHSQTRRIIVDSIGFPEKVYQVIGCNFDWARVEVLFACPTNHANNSWRTIILVDEDIADEFIKAIF